jgi:coenzyme F420-reducing hydrogenase alpha subunit
MKAKRILLALLVLLMMSGSGSAQTDQQIRQELRGAADLVRSKYQTTVSMMDIYQMGGNPQGVQICQHELQYHQQFFNYIEQLGNNPGQMRNPSVFQDYQAKYWEYCYRTKNQDYRSYQEIAPALQQFVAQANWEASTPEGQAAFQNRQYQNQVNFDNGQQRHRENVAAFDRNFQATREASNQRDKYHRQYVNSAIWEQTEYVNPYDGQTYMYDNNYHNGYPTMQNPDGSYTQLIPYQNY